FLLLPPLPPFSILFPYTTLFRSVLLTHNKLHCHHSFGIHKLLRNSSTPQLKLINLYLVVVVGACGSVNNFLTSANQNTCDAKCRSEEHTSELQSRRDLVCRLLLE